MTFEGLVNGGLERAGRLGFSNFFRRVSDFFGGGSFEEFEIICWTLWKWFRCAKWWRKRCP